MRSAASAIAWEFRQRHRWGLMGLGAYLLVLAAIKFLVLGPGTRVTFANEETFAFAVIVPITATFMYFLGVFTFGLSGDVAARQSIYPARMFTLPVTSSALAGWPMLFGAAAAACLWLATRLLAIWPAGVEIPIIWPALLAASLLAWTQALSWMAYPLPGLRVIVTVLWLATIDAIVMIALELKAHEPVMLAILAPHLPLAFLVARFAVARARRGDVPDWRGFFTAFDRIAGFLTRRRRPFASGARAQLWLEWRQHGRSLPWLVAILLPFELGLLFVFPDVPVIIYETLLLVAITPPFMATFVAATVGKQATPFVATRPLTSGSLIAAKLKATLGSAAVAWLLVIIAVPFALKLSGTAPVVLADVHTLVEVVGTPRAIAIYLLAFALLFASTWKQLVQSLYIGMSGREWLVKASVFTALAFVAVLGPLLHWIGDNRAVIAALWNAFPAIAAVLVVLKMSAAAWVAIRLRDSGLLSGRSLIAGAVVWDLLVLALYGLLVWIVPGMLIRHYVLALVAILEVPLARLAAAPLALAWSRHR